MTAALVDIFCRSFPSPPAAITLDIDDTCDAVHGQQQLSLFNAFYDTRCFLPVHVYHVESGKIQWRFSWRPGKTPSGAEVRTLESSIWCGASAGHSLCRTRLTFRGGQPLGPDRGHFMAWCEENEASDYASLRPGGQSRPAPSRIRVIADDLKVRRAEAGADRHARLRHTSITPPARGAGNAASSPGWNATTRVGSTPATSSPRSRTGRAISTKRVYCARGQAENLIKLHKGQARLRPDLMPEHRSPTSSASSCTPRKPTG